MKPRSLGKSGERGESATRNGHRTISVFRVQIGSETASARTNSEEHASMLTQLENLRSSISGVSINEETTNIIQFQRAFQASARIVSIVDELLQTTLAMGAGG
jgi:flagellar hook-associated protein FlgK